jgi:hypothetical protein
LSEARGQAAGRLEQVRREVAEALRHEKAQASAEAAAVAADMASKVLGRKVA